MPPCVLVEQRFHGGAVLGRVEHQHEDAEVPGVVNVRLGSVEEGVDLEQLGDERQGELGVVGAHALERQQDAALVLGIRDKSRISHSMFHHD